MRSNRHCRTTPRAWRAHPTNPTRKTPMADTRHADDQVTATMLRFERLLDAPVDKVWQYLVDPELRARWFMGGPTDLKVGGSIGLTMDHDRLSDHDVPTPERYRPYVGHSWSERIIRCEPPNVLAFTWENGD